MVSDSVSIPLQIRKIIFERFNDTTLRFTNDEIFDILKTVDIDRSLTIDDMAPFFKQLHEEGLIRPIAQDFTTQWYKIFAPIEKIKCNSCNMEIHLGKLEPRICPNSKCRAAI